MSLDKDKTAKSGLKFTLKSHIMKKQIKLKNKYNRSKSNQMQQKTGPSLYV